MQLVDRELCVTSAILEDISALSKLHDEATLEYKYNKEFIIKKPMHCLSFGDIPKDGNKDQYDILCINKGTSLIGCVSIYLDYPTDVDAVIRYMFITNNERNNEIGGRVVEKLLTYFYHANYENVYVNIPKFNNKAINFFKTHDFHECENNTLSTNYNFGADCETINLRMSL